MLKLGEANPLAVFGLRQLAHCPPHFTPVEFECLTSDKDITDWIWANLEGRFYFGDLRNPNKMEFESAPDFMARIQGVKRAAFETASEASYFALMLSTFNNHSF
jgi:hypothetical protein